MNTVTQTEQPLDTSAFIVPWHVAFWKWLVGE